MEQDNKFEKRIQFVAKHYREDGLDTEKAWKQFAAAQKVPERFTLPRYLFAIASVILLLVLVRVGFIYFGNTEEWITLQTEAGQQKEVLLPDGSQLVLAGNSSVSYDKKKFGDKWREVKMTGKVFYQVNRDESRPFSVQTPATVVTVLGTGFQIDEQPEATTVYVESGKVSFAIAGETTEAILTAGMTAVYKMASETIEFVGKDTNILSWKSRLLRFNATPLDRVVHDLESFYQVRITNRTTAEEELKLTATFNDLPIQEVLQIINHTLDVHLVAD